MGAELRKVPEGVEPLLSPAEACAVIGIGETTWYDWLHKHPDLRALLLTLPGGRKRVPAWQLRTWLEARSKTPLKLHPRN